MSNMFDNKIWQKLDKELSGWISEEEARFLVNNYVNGRYVEIGVAFGKSFRLARMYFDGLVHGVDIINHGVDVNGAKFICGDANKIVNDYKDSSIDTLFIDGDHTHKGCLSDFVHWYNKVKKGGRIIFHDYQRPTSEHKGVTETVDAIKPLLKDHAQAKYIFAGTKC